MEQRAGRVIGLSRELWFSIRLCNSEAIGTTLFALVPRVRKRVAVSTIGVAGHVCVDLTPSMVTDGLIRPGAIVEIGELAVAPGGCVGNTGLALRLLGADVRIAAAVGGDPLGRILVDTCEQRGLNTAGMVIIDDLPTSYSVVIQPPMLDRTIWHHVGANAAFDGTQVDLAGCDLVHLGYPSLLPSLLVDGGTPLVRWLERWHDEGATTSIDLAVIDPASSVAVLDWRQLITEISPLVDVLSPSLDDLRTAFALVEEPSIELATRLAEELVEAGVAVVAISAGSLGLTIAAAGAERLRRSGRILAPIADAWANARVHVDAQRIDQPVRTNGAGDVSTAALIRAMELGLEPELAGFFATSVAALHVAGAPLQPIQDRHQVSRVKPETRDESTRQADNATLSTPPFR